MGRKGLQNTVGEHNVKTVPLVPHAAGGPAPAEQPTLDLGLPDLDPPAGDQHGRIKHPHGEGFLPPWMQEEIDENKTARPRQRKESSAHYCCPRCKEIVIAATYDLHPKPGRVIMTATVDPTPLEPHTELACKLAGRATYTAQRAPLGGKLTILRARTARWDHTWKDQQVTLPAHQCGARFPTFHTPPYQPPASQGADDNEPPF